MACNMRHDITMVGLVAAVPVRSSWRSIRSVLAIISVLDVSLTDLSSLVNEQLIGFLRLHFVVNSAYSWRPREVVFPWSGVAGILSVAFRPMLPYALDINLVRTQPARWRRLILRAGAVSQGLFSMIC